jgi:hypothetical protein
MLPQPRSPFAVDSASAAFAAAMAAVGLRSPQVAAPRQPPQQQPQQQAPSTFAEALLQVMVRVVRQEEVNDLKNDIAVLTQFDIQVRMQLLQIRPNTAAAVGQGSSSLSVTYGAKPRLPNSISSRFCFPLRPGDAQLGTSLGQQWAWQSSTLHDQLSQHQQGVCQSHQQCK